MSSPVSLRYGGVQPASRKRADMFGDAAPIWLFLDRFGGAADPFDVIGSTLVFETYPVLAMIALGWLREDARPTGRLPKYNPGRRQTFAIDDWRYVCLRLAAEFRARGLTDLVAWLDLVADAPAPSKADQDEVDACLCLLVALHV